MPIKTWAAGDELLAGDLNTYLANQVVATFASAAARDAAFAPTPPDKGQLCTLDEYTGALWIWTGTAWAETGPFQQAGYAEVGTNGAGVGLVAYPRPFAAPGNAVFFTHANDASGANGLHLGLVEGPSWNTAAGFTFVARYVSGVGAVAASATVKFFWLAQGYRAPD